MLELMENNRAEAEKEDLDDTREDVWSHADANNGGHGNAIGSLLRVSLRSLAPGREAGKRLGSGMEWNQGTKDGVGGVTRGHCLHWNQGTNEVEWAECPTHAEVAALLASGSTYIRRKT